MVLVRTYSVLARSTPETAFAYVSDVARHPEWSQHNMKVTREGVGPLVVGSRYDTVGDARGKPQAARVEVTRLQPPTGFSFTATEKKSTASGSVQTLVWLHEFTIAPAGNGTTRIDRTVTVLSPPLVLSVVFTLLHPFLIGPGNMTSMGMLKERLEDRETGLRWPLGRPRGGSGVAPR